MTLVAPRIVNDVSCVKRINHDIHFSFGEIWNDSRSANVVFFNTKCS